MVEIGEEGTSFVARIRPTRTSKMRDWAGGISASTSSRLGRAQVLILACCVCFEQLTYGLAFRSGILINPDHTSSSSQSALLCISVTFDIASTWLRYASESLLCLSLLHLSHRAIWTGRTDSLSLGRYTLRVSL